MYKTTKETVENIVWKACDTFYKDYILSMLFVKYLSDFAKEKKKELEIKYKGDSERLKRAVGRMSYKVSEDASFEYLLQNKKL